MASLPLRQRAWIALAGYAAVGLFAAAFVALGHLPVAIFGPDSERPEIAERLVMAAVAVLPLVLAAVWERIKGFKVGEFGIEFAEVSATIDVTLAAAVQAMESSATPELVKRVSLMATLPELRLVEVNLRRQPYWWSTRLFLLSALAQDYTHVERLVFVRDDGDRVFVGLATPAAVRAALERQYPGLKQAFDWISAAVAQPGTGHQQQIEGFGWQWPSHPFISDGQPVPEREFRVLVKPDLLVEWLGPDLETDSRNWPRGRPSNESYAAILSSNQAYVPLLLERRLQVVVDRLELQALLAAYAVSG